MTMAVIELDKEARIDSLDDLAEAANDFHARSQAAGRACLENAIKAGEMLARAKSEVRHGEWLPWLAENFAGSQDTAERYRKLAANSARVRNLAEEDPELSIREALKVIADDKPATKKKSGVPSDVRDAVNGEVTEKQLEMVNDLRLLLRTIFTAKETMALPSGAKSFIIETLREAAETLEGTI